MSVSFQMTICVKFSQVPRRWPIWKEKRFPKFFFDKEEYNARTRRIGHSMAPMRTKRRLKKQWILINIFYLKKLCMSTSVWTNCRWEAGHWKWEFKFEKQITLCQCLSKRPSASDTLEPHEDKRRNVFLSLFFHKEEYDARRGRLTAPSKTKRRLKQ